MRGRGVSTFVLILGGLVALAGCGVPTTSATVTQWTTDSGVVSGTVYNGEGRGCSDMEVTLHLYDHNQAVVSDFTFGAGEVANATTKPFTTQIVGLFGIPQLNLHGIVRVEADAACKDRT